MSVTLLFAKVVEHICSCIPLGALPCDHPVNPHYDVAGMVKSC